MPGVEFKCPECGKRTRSLTDIVYNTSTPGEFIMTGIIVCVSCASKNYPKRSYTAPIIKVNQAHPNVKYYVVPRK